MPLHLLASSIYNLQTVFENHELEHLPNIISFIHLASRPQLLLYKQAPDPVFLCPWFTSKHCSCCCLTKEMAARAGYFLAPTQVYVFRSVFTFPLLTCSCPRMLSLQMSSHELHCPLNSTGCDQCVDKAADFWMEGERDEDIYHLFPAAQTWPWQWWHLSVTAASIRRSPIHPPRACFPLLHAFLYCGPSCLGLVMVVLR